MIVLMFVVVMVIMMITSVNNTIAVTKSISHMQCKYQKHVLNINSSINITYMIKIQL